MLKAVPFAFPVEKSTPAWKKYTNAVGGVADKYQVWLLDETIEDIDWNITFALSLDEPKGRYQIRGLLLGFLVIVDTPSFVRLCCEHYYNYCCDFCDKPVGRYQARGLLSGLFVTLEASFIYKLMLWLDFLHTTTILFYVNQQ